MLHASAARWTRMRAPVSVPLTVVVTMTMAAMPHMVNASASPR